ncbi:MAG: orotidine-5-phosphate decarboxylase [Gaiellaceae bacterium]|nr:orotidine-5-phosphate decarboxylase [Gaiellaceae bacterium]
MAQELRTEPALATTSFGDRLADAVERKRSQLVVGLDPQVDLLPVELRGDVRLGREHAAEAFGRFCRGVIDAVAPYVVAVKPQSAFFEELGADGVRALEDVCAYARQAGLLVILDAKRGDIGSTSRAYAAAFLEPRGQEGPLSDALTVNPYLGRDALEPMLAACKRDGAGIFCVVKTSNAGSAEVQDAILTDGKPLWQHVARLVREWGEDVVGARGLSSVGAVIGATHPRAVGEARRLLPQSILLLPGGGAQGATPADVARAFTSGPASALVTVSRALIYAFRVDGGEWRAAAGAEAARLRGEVWSVSGW